ncbi:hypothetical protein ACF1BB_01760 [Streptomyces griseoluteus]
MRAAGRPHGGENTEAVVSGGSLGWRIGAEVARQPALAGAG